LGGGGLGCWAPRTTSRHRATWTTLTCAVAAAARAQILRAAGQLFGGGLPPAPHGGSRSCLGLCSLRFGHRSPPPPTFSLLLLLLVRHCTARTALYQRGAAGSRYTDQLNAVSCVSCVSCVEWYSLLDNLDGRQARRTGTSSPLGELFDHGCDCLAVAVRQPHPPSTTATTIFWTRG
jgi:hypothetical protein